MKTHRLLYALLAMIMLACLSGVQGQYYQMPSSGYQTTAPVSTVGSSAAATQYSQYYMMQGAPSTHISAPIQFNIAGRVPNNLYFGTQNQAVPFAQYMYNPAYTGANSLWIQGTTDWSQYASVPQGATMMLVAVTRMGGNGYITEIRPDGTVSNTNFYFYPYSQMTFYADTIGRHILSFNVVGQSSNTVVIDVTASYTTPSNYPQLGYSSYNYPTYYPYYSGYMPSYYPYYSGYMPSYYPYNYPYNYPYYMNSYPYYFYPSYYMPIGATNPVVTMPTTSATSSSAPTTSATSSSATSPIVTMPTTSATSSSVTNPIVSIPTNQKTSQVRKESNEAIGTPSEAIETPPRTVTTTPKEMETTSEAIETPSRAGTITPKEVETTPKNIK